MKVMKKIIASLLTAAIVFSLAACGNSDTASVTTEKTGAASTSTATEVKKEPVTLSFVIPSSWANREWYKGIIAKYEEKSGNKIDVQAIQDDQYTSVLKSKFVGNADVDICSGDFSAFNVPESFLEITGEAFEARVDAVSLDSLKYDGKIYGFPIPNGVETYGVFYNKKVFADAGITELPNTLDEFDKLCATLLSKNITPLYWACKDAWTIAQFNNGVNGVAWTTDNDIWNKMNTNKIQFKDIPEWMNEYKAAEGWISKGYCNEDRGSATYDQQCQALANGTAAMCFMGSWFEGDVVKQNPDAELGFFTTPSTKGDGGMASAGYSGGWHIFKSSKNVDAAKDFLRFIVEPEQVKYVLSLEPGISAYKDAKVEDLKGSLKDIQAVIDSGKISVHGDGKILIPAPSDEVMALYTELFLKRINADEFGKMVSDAYLKNAKQSKMAGF